MRVLQVNRFFSNRGGAETVLFQTMRLLERYGHDVVTFSMQDASNLPSRYAEYFVRHVDLRRTLKPPGFLAPWRWPTAARALYSREAKRNLEALIQATKPDIAHLHSVYHQLSPSVLQALRRHGIPTVLTLHDYKIVCPSSLMFANGSICDRCKGHKYYHAVLQGCVQDSRLKSVFCASESYLHTAWGIYSKGVDVYVAPSQFIKSQMAKFGLDEERIMHVPNPLDLEKYQPNSSSGSYFVYMGRIEPAKGVATLLKAVERSEMARGLELRIAGDGEQRADLETFCRDRGLSNVRWVGWLSQEQLAALLRGALFAVVPSEWYEVFSLATLEAQAFGKPVIGARIGGIPELVEEGKSGLLFEPSNAKDLQAKIEYLIANRERAVEMGKRARGHVEETCAPDRQYERLMDVYERACQAHGKRAVTAKMVCAGAAGTDSSKG